jgi:hypothetical protein
MRKAVFAPTAGCRHKTKTGHVVDTAAFEGSSRIVEP